MTIYALRLADVLGIMQSKKIEFRLMFSAVIQPLLTERVEEIDLESIDAGAIIVLGNADESRVKTAVRLLRYGAGSFKGFPKWTLRIYYQQGGAWKPLAGPKPEMAEAGLSCVQEEQATDAIGAAVVIHTTRNGKGRVGRIRKGEE